MARSLSRLDPRVKLWYMVLGIALIFLARDVVPMAIIVLAAQVALILVGVSIRQIVRVWVALLPLIVIIMVLQPLLRPHGTPIWCYEPVCISQEGVRLAVRYALQLVAAAFIVMLPVATTPMPLLVRALVKLGMPYTLGMTIGLALHYLETIGSLYRQIEEAQQARGWDLSSGRLWKRVRAAIPTLIAVIIASLRLSDSLALGLAARGFSLGLARTVRNDIRMSAFDWAVLGITTAAFISGVALILR